MDPAHCGAGRDRVVVRDYGRKLTAFAEHCHEEGVPLSFHHHMGTAVESEDDVDRLRWIIRLRWLGRFTRCSPQTSLVGTRCGRRSTR